VALKDVKPTGYILHRFKTLTVIAETSTVFKKFFDLKDTSVRVFETFPFSLSTLFILVMTSSSDLKFMDYFAKLSW
jgi:hypothetical protein